MIQHFLKKKLYCMSYERNLLKKLKFQTSRKNNVLTFQVLLGFQRTLS